MSTPLLPFPFGNTVMIAVGCIFIYLAIKKKYEPLLLIPIGFGAILVNIPILVSIEFPGIMDPEGFLGFIYAKGVLTDIFPCLLFIGIGAMMDFGALIERPWFLIFAAAGQLGIFIALLCALAAGFNPLQASCIGIIGAMDGPTAIFITSTFARNYSQFVSEQMIGPVTVCAYSYMSLVPLLQIPISKGLTTRKERLIKMEYKSQAYSKVVRIIFPIAVIIITCVIAPMGTPLMGSLMLGNLLKESGVVRRLAKSAENEIANVTTLLLGIVIGGTMNAESFLVLNTLIVFGLGLVAFVSAIACGILFAKLVCFMTKGKVNPLIGACGISAFPMAARTAHRIGREEDSSNWLLPHAMATNMGGQIGSVVAGGVVLTYAPAVMQMLGLLP
jgi:sodium ion-translocating decarboxylase beta subunit